MRRTLPGIWPMLLIMCLGVSGTSPVPWRSLGATVEAMARGSGPASEVRLESIVGRIEGQAVAVLIQSSAPVPYLTTQPDPLTVLVDLRNVRSEGVSNRFTATAQDSVSAVSVEDVAAPDGTPVARVRVQLARPVAPRVRSDRNVIRVEVDRNAAQPAQPSTAQPSVPAASAPAAAPPALPPSPQAPAPQLTGKAGEKQYTGTPISLDFTGADIRTVLRSFVDFSGLNIIIDPKVQGSVDIALRDVPWDQALDIILKSNGLGYTVDGTVVRIAPISVLSEEEAQRRKLAEEQALGGSLETLTRTLSYANAEEMKNVLLRSQAVTKRGQVEIDKRSNSVIVRDLPGALPTVSQILDSLDKPQPQVEIEARIVSTTRTFLREIGVQWGVLGQVSPALGNTTPLAFPNQGSISGRSGGDNNTSPTGVPYAVNLGTTKPATSAVGLTLGSVNGAFNLDVALSALETSGQGRILSSPRVLAQNNFQAEMTQGVQVPIQTVANNTVTVQFKDAALKLLVTPQITANQTVIMSIELENATPDYSKSVNNIPPINTQRAKTQVLIKDNDTIVIGGIYLSREQVQSDRTPGLHSIPLLGWLFKRNSVNEENDELVIFITPRIMK